MSILQRIRGLVRRTSETRGEDETKGGTRSPERPWPPLRDGPGWAWGSEGSETEAQWHRRITRGRDEDKGF